MNAHYASVVAGLLLYCTGINQAISQSGGPEFLNCSSVPVSLCVQDEGVQLPLSNQIYQGDLNLNASSCSVQIRQRIRVKSTCGHSLRYEVQIFLYDTSAAYMLQPLTEVVMDTSGEAELEYNTKKAEDDFVRINGLPYTTGCFPYHRIKWIVTDSCGNINSCEQRINVFDCFPPQYRLKSQDYVLSFNYSGFVYANAKDIFLSVVDDCTRRGELTYSFSPFKFQPDSAISCYSVPAYGVELPYTVWIADRGRDLNCDGEVSWQEKNLDSVIIQMVFVDNVGLKCGDYDPHNSISGKILTEYGRPVSNVSVNLNILGHVYPTYVTGDDGHFNFSYYDTKALSGSVTAERNDNSKNGVSTLDLIRIRKHLLGIEDLHSPYDLIAADANNSQNVSGIDLVELMKLILGVYTSLPNNRSWRFVPKSFVFADTTHPWPFPEVLNFQLTGDVSNADFVGIKVGDVNHSARRDNTAGIQEPAYPPLAVVTDQQFYSSNQEVNILLKLQFDGSILGFQFTLTSPELEFQEITMSGIQWFNSNYALFDDQLTLSWFDGNLIPAPLDSVFVIIKARAKRAGNLKQSLTINSNITTAEFYDAAEKIYRPILRFNDGAGHLFIFNPTPNPWKEECTIPFYLPEDGIVNISVSTLSGEKEYRHTQYFGSGNHEIKLSRKDFRHQGVMIFTIQEKNAVQSKLMILE